MGIILNVNTINSLYIGTTPVNRAYFGDVLIFGTEPAPSSGITITSDGKGLVIPQGTTIKSYSEESGTYTLPTSVTIPNASVSSDFSGEGITWYYNSGVVVQNQTTQTGKIFSGSPIDASVEYNGNGYYRLTSAFQNYINDFNYSGSSYKQVGSSRNFPELSSTSEGIRHVDLGAFNVHTEAPAKLTKFNVKVQIMQFNTGNTETTLKALYAVDGDGNLLKEVTNLDVADGIRYLLPQIDSNTKKPIHILADIDKQDTIIQIFLSVWCQDVTETTNYDAPLYLRMTDMGDMGDMGRMIDARTSVYPSESDLCSLKVTTDGNIYELTT